MIRKMIRRKVVALVAIVGIALSGTSQLLAAAAENAREERAAAAPWFVQLLDSQGRALTPPAKRHIGALTLADIEQARNRILELQKSSDPRTVAKVTRALRWLDIATAKTALERHDLIRKLPVTVTTAEATDGRAGVVKSFLVGGKPRLQWFVPAGSRLTVPSEGGEADNHGGPSVRDDCYNGEPEPCMTEQEMEDLGITLAQAQGDLDAQNAEFAQAEGEYNDYCSQHPSNCENFENDTLPLSGPSAWDSRYAGCGGQLAGAAYYTALAGGTIWAGASLWGSAMALGGLLAVASGALIVVAVAGTLLLAGAAIYEFVSCKRALPYHLPLDTGAQLRYEPVY